MDADIRTKENRKPNPCPSCKQAVTPTHSTKISTIGLTVILGAIAAAAVFLLLYPKLGTISLVLGIALLFTSLLGFRLKDPYHKCPECGKEMPFS